MGCNSSSQRHQFAFCEGQVTKPHTGAFGVVEVTLSGDYKEGVGIELYHREHGVLVRRRLSEKGRIVEHFVVFAPEGLKPRQVSTMLAKPKFLSQWQMIQYIQKMEFLTSTRP